MIGFLLKGLLRDRSRSLFPLLVVTAGVAMTVVLHAFLSGAFADLIGGNANFQTGHVKIMTAAYADQADQLPNDLALLDLDDLLAELARDFPQMVWAPRIRFGGLLDIPDEQGLTRAQGPVAGLAVDLLGSDLERGLLNLEKALVRGHLPREPGELLVSDALATRLDLSPGERVTLIGATMYGGMATANFTLAGTLRFGVPAMDRGAVIADLADVQQALDMENAAGELLGFFGDFRYRDAEAMTRARLFTAAHAGEGEFAAVMVALRQQNGLAELLDMGKVNIAVIVVLFVGMMFIVLWNAGLMNSLRRYGEIGVRLAIGEQKGHLYRAMLWEALLLGLAGSTAGTLVGLAAAWYLQVHGLDYSSAMQSSSMMITTVLRAQVTPLTFVIGFVPGTLATLLGTAVSGIGIYRRQTAHLFKELEV